MTSSHPPSPSTADLTLISRVRDAMDAHNLNQIDVMRDSGVSNSVLCLWLQSRYKGDNAKVNQRLARWLDNLAPPQSPSAVGQQLYSHGGVVGHPAALVLPPTQLQQQTALADYIVPIRLHAVIGSQSYTDCFLWNLHEQRLTPRQFVQQLCRDVGLSHDWLQPLTQQFKLQVKLHRTHLTQPPNSATASRPASSHPLLRLRLDLTLDGVRLTDQFLWDPLHPHSSPEEYARVLVGDLGLGGEWTPLIAWSIRDQLLAAAEGRTGEGAVEEVHWLGAEADGETAAEEEKEHDGEATEASSKRRKVAVFRVGAESDGWGPELHQVWDKLADMDSSGVSSTPVVSAVTEYEREKEADKQAQRERKRADKEREKPSEKERDQQATAQQIRQQQQMAAQAPVIPVDPFGYR